MNYILLKVSGREGEREGEREGRREREGAREQGSEGARERGSKQVHMSLIGSLGPKAEGR